MKAKRIFVVLSILVMVTGIMFASGAKESKADSLKVIRFLNQETDPATVRVQRGWITDFQKENPDISVVLEGAPMDAITQTIATYIQAGAPLDVIMADGGSAANLAVQGLLEPLDDLVERLGGRSAFMPGRLLIVDDKVYAINSTSPSPVLHYRKDIFEQLDLDPPTTWENILVAAKTIHEEVDGMSGFALPGGENRATTIMSGVFLWQAGGNFFDRNLDVTLDNERTYEALDFYAELLKYAPAEASGWSFNEPIESFFSGRSAMVLYWHGLDLTYRSNPDMIENVGVVGAATGHMQVTEQGGRYNLVFKNSDNLEASMKWMEYMFTPENSVKITELSPALFHPTTYASMELLKKSDAPPIKAYGDLLFDVIYPTAEVAYNQILHAGGINPETKTIEDTFIVNPYVNILWNSNIYARAIQQVAYGGMSAQEAAAKAQIALESQIEDQ